MAGVGNTQIVNGKSYTLYSPQWYAATQAEAQRAAAATGTAAGSAIKAESVASGVPLPTGVVGPTGSIAPPSLPPSVQGLSLAAGGSTPLGGVSGVSGGTTPGGMAGGGSGSPASSGSGYAHLAPVDTSAAEAASFAKAKDQVGSEATGSLTGLRSALASRNMLGGGLEERGTVAAGTAAEGQLGDVTRQQAVTRADLAQKNAETNFTGDIAQRGQDFQKEEAGNTLAADLAKTTYQGQITQRQQDIQYQTSQEALAIEQAQIAAQQRATALAGLESALKVTAPNGLSY